MMRDQASDENLLAYSEQPSQAQHSKPNLSPRQVFSYYDLSSTLPLRTRCRRILMTILMLFFLAWAMVPFDFDFWEGVENKVAWYIFTVIFNLFVFWLCSWSLAVMEYVSVNGSVEFCSCLVRSDVTARRRSCGIALVSYIFSIHFCRIQTTDRAKRDACTSRS